MTALLVKLNKRYSNHYSFIASYALQKQERSMDRAWSDEYVSFFQTYGPICRISSSISPVLANCHGDSASASITSSSPATPEEP